MSGYLRVPRRKKFITEEQAATIIQEQLGGLDLSDLGKGISSITIYYLNTKRSSNVTIDMELDDRDNGVIWTVNFVAPGALYPYTWKYTHIVYSDNTTFDSACELAAQYNSGGVSIVDIRTWYLNTSLSSVTRPNNEEERIAAGWVSTFTSPTSDARYTWKYTEHVYSDGNSVYSDIELVAIFVRDGMGTQDAYAVWGEEAPIITVKNQNLPISQDGPTWYYNFDSLTVGENQYLWMSERVHNGVTFEEWCDPIRISGNQGKAGEDAEDIEFIYKRSDRTPTTNDTPTIPPTLSPENDYVPDYLDRQTRFGDTFDDAYKVERNLGWKDNPQGVGWADTDEDGVDDTFFKYEWMSQRVKPRTSDPDNTNWGTWTKPVVWSVYGDKGMDGDGVEYIFKLTKKTVTSLQRPSSTQGETNDQGEWIPYTDPSVLDDTEKAWTDNPTGTSPTWQKEWVSIRKKINDTWGPFSIPTIWNNYCDIYIDEHGHWVVNGEWTEWIAEGQDGTGIIIRGNVETYLDKQNGQSSLQAVDTSQCEIGDCYVVEENQHLHVFNGTIDPEDWTKSWSDLGEFRGEPGISSYIHLAWANGITFTATGELEGIVEFSIVKGTKDWDWMGICVTDSTQPNAAEDPGRDRWKEYKWNHIKGKDGTNFEKVFLLTDKDIAPIVDEYTPYEGKTREDYEYLPAYSFEDGEEHTPPDMTRFTDDPSNVSPEFPFQWVAERERKEDPDDGVVKWFSFNTPTLWSTYSKDGDPGQASYKANVFKRSVDAPELPEPAANDFEHPLPEGWFDSFPATGTGPVWMITRIFTSDRESPQQATWVGPILMKDDEGNFDVEFSDNPIDSRPPIPVKSGTGANCHNSGDDQIWYDPDDDEDYLSNPAHKMNWMATRTRIINQAGVPDWGHWTITLIRGERGYRGNGVEYAYAVFNSNVDTSKIVLTSRQADTPESPINMDGSAGSTTWSRTMNDLQYGVDKYIWMTQRTYTNGEYGLWENPPIRISGDKGRPGTDAEDIEFIYKTETSMPAANEPKPNNDRTQDDYVPRSQGWEDNPQGVTPERKYEWMCQRIKLRVTDPNYDSAQPWSDWNGPFVWSAYGDTGMDGDGVEYVFFLGSEPYKPSSPVLIYKDSGNISHSVTWRGDVYNASTTPNEYDWRPKDFSLGEFSSWSNGSYNGQGEWIPGGGYDNNNNWVSASWTDNPTGVGPSSTEEWVSIRKKIGGEWKDFSKPTRWTNYSVAPYIHIVDGIWYLGDDPLYDNNGDPVSAEGPQGQGIQLKDTVDFYSNSEKSQYGDENDLTDEELSKYTTLQNVTPETVNDISAGDCYVVKYGEHARFLYVCITGLANWEYDDGHDEWEQNWDEIGEFQGEPGLNSYMHIAWASTQETGVTGNIHFDSDGKIDLIKKYITDFTQKDPDIEYEWMGVSTDHESLDPPSNYDLSKDDGHSTTDGLPLNWRSYKWNSVRGRDGDNFERVYIRTSSEAIKPDFKKDTNGNYVFETYEEPAGVPHAYQSSEYLPAVYIDPESTYSVGVEYERYRFTDDPIGVEERWKAEWMAERKKKRDPVDGVVKWFSFSKPSLWATYSSSQPWIKSSCSTIVVNTNSAGKLTSNFTITFKTQLYSGSEGPIMPVVTSCTATFNYFNATVGRTNDNLGTNNEVSWTFTIPKTVNGSDNVLSGEHDLEIKMTDGGKITATELIHVSISKSAQSSYKSTMFVRMNDVPSSPGDAGDYNNPSPSGCVAGTNSDGESVSWSDGIPSGTNTLWASTRKFTSDGVNQDASWSTPREMTDTEYYDVEFAKKQTNDGTPPDPIKEGNDANCNGSGANQIWYDPVNDSSEDFTQMYWRAERECRNGEWGDWTVIRIKGETGNTGYSAQLSRTGDILTIDSVGNIVGTASLSSRFYTDVIIWQDLGNSGGRTLTYHTGSGSPIDGEYTLSISGNNCTPGIINTGSENLGRIYVNSITNTSSSYHNCSIEIEVTTYDGSSFYFEYTVGFSHLDQPYLGFNLTNEFDDITYRTGSKKYFGVPVETYIEAYAGNYKIDGTNLTKGYFNSVTISGDLVGSSPVMVSSTRSGSNITYGESTISVKDSSNHNTGLLLYVKSNGYVKLYRNTSSTADIDLPDDKHNLDISCQVIYAGVTYNSPSKRFTIKEITDTTLYDLFLPVTSISEDHGVYDPTYQNFKVQAIIEDESGKTTYDPIPATGQITGSIYVKYIKSTYDPTKTYYLNASQDSSTNKIYTLYPTCQDFSTLPGKIFTVALVDSSTLDFLDVQSVTINSCGDDGDSTLWMDLDKTDIKIDCEADGTIINTRQVTVTASLHWGDITCSLTQSASNMSLGNFEGSSNVGVGNKVWTPSSGTPKTALSKTFTFTAGNKLGSGEIIVTLKGTADGTTYTLTKTVTITSQRKGDTGVGGFKSIVFKRTNTELTASNTPSGGNFGSPYPDPLNGWSDGIPAGAEKLWASSCTFYSNNTDTGWSTPRSMTDTDYYDVEFAKKQTNDSTPSDPVKYKEKSENNPCNSWRPSDYMGNDVVNQIWFDPKLNSSQDFTKMYWRAERECLNGVWGNWTIIRIKGEGSSWIKSSISSVVIEVSPTGTLTSNFSQSFTTTLYRGDVVLIPSQASSCTGTYNGSSLGKSYNSTTGVVTWTLSRLSGASPTSGNITITMTKDDYSATITIPVVVNRINRSSFKSTMFVRMDGTPTKPADDKGSFDNPSPTGCTAGLNSNNVSVTWSDGIPAGSDSIWATSRRFTSDEVNQDDSWSNPTKMVDNDYYDVEFARIYSNGTSTDTTPPDPVKSGSGANCNGSGTNQIWFDPKLDSGVDFTKMYWRAEREYKNGSWGSWIKVRIKGESGNDGVGVESITPWYKISSLTTGIVLPPPNVSPSSSPYYWYNEYIEPTEEKPYLWKFVKTTYTDSSKTPTQSEPELVRVWSRGNTNPNLLDDTDFESTNDMDAWYAKGVVNGTSSVPATDITATLSSGVDSSTFDGEHYSYYVTFRAKPEQAGTGYIQFLEQYVYKTDQTVKRIEPNQWYTLSFHVGGRINTNNGSWSDDTPFLIAADMKDVIAPVSTFYVDEASYQTNTTTDKRYINISITNSGEGNNNPTFDKHVITFKTPSSFTKNMAVKFHLYTRANNRRVWISMPKLEFGKVSTGYTSGSYVRDPFPRTSAWAEGNWYYRGNYGEPFLDVVTYGGSWFRCRESHLASDLNKPIFDQKTTFWEPASNLDFIATDLVLAKTAFIDNLIATKVRTADRGVPHVEMQGSTVEFYGRHETPSIILDVIDDEDNAYNGCGVLKFLDASGRTVYNLGPEGLTRINNNPSSFRTLNYKEIVSGNTLNAILNVKDRDTTPYYKFSEGYTHTDSGYQYYISLNSLPSNWDGKLYDSRSMEGSGTAAHPSGTAVTGWFVEANNGNYSQAMDLADREGGPTRAPAPYDYDDSAAFYVIFVHGYKNGKLKKSTGVYFYRNDKQIRDMNGTPQGTNLYSYLGDL